MNDSKLLYKLSGLDRDKNMAGVYVKKPKIIGILENDGVQLKTTSKMKYFKMPKSSDYPLDLNIGFENYKSRSFKSGLDEVAFFLMNSPHELNRSEGVEHPPELSGAEKCDNNDEFGDLGNYDVITHRRTLALLMETPYMWEGHNNKWTIVATKYKNKLYLSKTTDETPPSNDNCERNPRISYHFKFAQYCFSDDPNRDPDTSVPINEDQKIFCVYNTQLLNFNLIYLAEIDGILSDTKLEYLQDIGALERSRFVHTKLMPNFVRNWTKNYRLLSWWIKSYLAGVDDMYMGFRTEDGLVKQPVKHLLIKQLPEGQRWSPKVCVNFIHTFIKMVLKEMRGVDTTEQCYEFSFDSSHGCIYYNISNRPSLTKDFIEFLKKNDA